MDVEILSRLQFALTIMFHYIFPPITIGMGIVLVYLDGMYLKTRDPLYEVAAKFWTKIFALNFAIGVASGIVMEFEFGTNWATYSRFVGDVFGSALAAEGIFAFFLESGFLAVLVFGWDRVSAGMHFFATCMVALGSIFSSIWIVIANSWQQTPAGSQLVQIQIDKPGTDQLFPWFIENKAGELVPMMRAEITDFWSMVFNPSTVDRLTHVWLGCFLMGAFFIMSISAFYLLKGRHVQFAKHSFRGALFLAAISSVLIGFSGDSNARMIGNEQPAKLAAFEGHYVNDGEPSGIYVFGIPDPANEEIDLGLQIPYGLTFLLHRNFTEPVIGLNQFPEEDWPLVAIPFICFHTMVGMGVLMLGVSFLALFFLWRGTLWDKRWLLWVCVFMVFAPLIANQTGWIAAETGRQPWVVHPPIVRAENGEPLIDENNMLQYETVTPPVIEAGMDIAVTGQDGQTQYITASERIAPEPMTAGLRTSEALSKAVEANQVLGSIVMFGLIYLLLGAVWVVVLTSKIMHGPEDPDQVTEIGKDQFLDAAARRHEASLTDRNKHIDDMPHTD